MIKKITKAGIKSLLADIPFDIAGGLLYATAIECFNSPNNIAPGGVGGLSILVNYVTGLPISLVALLMNTPLLILAFFFLGRQFTVKTMKTVLIQVLMLEWSRLYLPAYTGDTILAALYGGVLIGAGLSLVFMRGSTTGGTDIVARLIQRRLPYFSVGKLLMAADGCVLLTAAVVYRNVENALYALITIFVTSRILDSFLYGLDVGKVILIISDKYTQIADAVSREMERGCTLLQGSGAYTGKDRPVLMCAIRRQQFYELKMIVHGIDPAAFMMAMEANEIIGEGFKALSNDKAGS